MAYKVMIADDEPIMRKAMSSLIHWEEYGCNLVYAASNGQEVMERLELLKPDILILDIRMPGMSGIDIAQHIWEHKFPAKVILLTAYADFSYAQSAIKYNIIDYVIKTGGFEGILSALEKAKEQILAEQKSQSANNSEVHRENFFKSVFDGSLYLTQEIVTRAERLKLSFEAGYLVLVIQFSMDEKREGERKLRVYTSLMNFFKMVFEEHLFHSVTVKKDMLALVLSEIPENYQEDIRCKCLQIIDMMDNFMKLSVYIGISRRMVDIRQLKSGYEEAEYAVSESFFDEKSKIIFFGGKSAENKEYQGAIEKKLEELKHLLRRGETEDIQALFHEIVNFQKQAGGAIHNILNTGINIRMWCRNILNEYDKSLYDITPYQGSISEMIYQCRHVDEYLEIVDTLLSKTAEYVRMSARKKKVLIYECQNYIEENYETCIMAADVAASIGVSHSYLSRIFKETTGSTIIQFINMKKMDKAKKYLLETDMKIYEIAEALGFENITYFSHFFKKHSGVSPKDYKGEA